MSSPDLETADIEIDKENRELVIGDQKIALRDANGGKLSVDHVSDADGYIAFTETNQTITFEGTADGGEHGDD